MVFCVLVFFFALYAKTAPYGAGARANGTPSTASKLWVSGQEFDIRFAPPEITQGYWVLLLTLCAPMLDRRLWVRRALASPPPIELLGWQPHRCLRSPPFQG